MRGKSCNSHRQQTDRIPDHRSTKYSFRIQFSEIEGVSTWRVFLGLLTFSREGKRAPALRLQIMSEEQNEGKKPGRPVRGKKQVNRAALIDRLLQKVLKDLEKSSAKPTLADAIRLLQ